MKIHPVFHKVLLEPAPQYARIERRLELDDNLNNKEYEVEEALARELLTSASGTKRKMDRLGIEPRSCPPP